MNGRYCAYLRKSRADEIREQLDESYDALAHHRQTLEELSARMRVQIDEWYEEGIKSGDSIESRPQMQRLLEDVVSHKWDGVLCMEVERLTRGDMVDQGIVGRAFTESGTLIVTPLKVYDPASEADMEYFEFGLFMSRREFKTIKKRLYQGRVAAAKEGQFIGSTPPYGYSRVVKNGMHTLEPNGDARFVSVIFEEYAKGLSYRKIAGMLDAIGAKPIRGEKWSPASVANILTNSVYRGRIVWGSTKQTAYRENGRTRYRTEYPDEYIDVQGLHVPIISGELWEAAQKRRNAAPARPEYEQRNIFGRILVCAECGRALHWRKPSHEGGQAVFTHLHKGEGCMTKGCSARKLEALVADALESCAEDIEIPFGDAPKSRRADFEKAVADAHKTIEDNFDRMERGIITEEDFVRRRKVLEQRISDAEKALDELPDEDTVQKAASLRECVAAIKDHAISVEAKRNLIWALVDRIEYKNRGFPRHDEIELEIYLR